MIALTTNEAAALTGLDESAVRKDVELGVIEVASPPRFAEPVLVYFLARAQLGFQLGVEDRKRLYTLITDAIERDIPRVEVGRGWLLDVGEIEAALRDRLVRFEAWKQKLVISDAILGGEPVFPGSRLAIRHVGEMLSRGGDPREIREDYPYLSDEDLVFARLYAAAYPKMGRPRARASS
jgi:uncharacterized protein (DUF433 family)